MNGRALTDHDQGTEGGCATWALQTAPHNHSVITIGTEHAVQLTASFSGRSVATRRSSWHEGLPARHGRGGRGGDTRCNVPLQLTVGQGQRGSGIGKSFNLHSAHGAHSLQTRQQVCHSHLHKTEVNGEQGRQS